MSKIKKLKSIYCHYCGLLFKIRPNLLPDDFKIFIFTCPNCQTKIKLFNLTEYSIEDVDNSDENLPILRKEKNK